MAKLAVRSAPPWIWPVIRPPARTMKASLYPDSPVKFSKPANVTALASVTPLPVNLT